MSNAKTLEVLEAEYAVAKEAPEAYRRNTGFFVPAKFRALEEAARAALRALNAAKAVK